VTVQHISLFKHASAFVEIGFQQDIFKREGGKDATQQNFRRLRLRK
jgi:hypothetical protein